MTFSRYSFLLTFALSTALRLPTDEDSYERAFIDMVTKGMANDIQLLTGQEMVDPQSELSPEQQEALEARIAEPWESSEAESEATGQSRPPSNGSVALLTSLYYPGEKGGTRLTNLHEKSGTRRTNPHFLELAAALWLNLQNPHITEVHVMLESPSGSECKRLLRFIAEEVGQPVLTRKVADKLASKLMCVPVKKQPSYNTFFDYANRKLLGRLVLLANTDIAFDSSLGLIQHTEFTGGLGYVLSVKPPPYAGDYKKQFGHECNSRPRCTLGKYDGWASGGNSWDAYVFLPPIQDMHRGGLNHFMNTYGGENLAAYEVEVEGGVKLWNPCMHIHAFHWHCIGGKMHSGSVQVDNGEKKIYNIAPCWDCPALTMPKGTSPSKDLCLNGKRRNMKEFPKQVSRYFRNAACTWVCLANEKAEQDLKEINGRSDEVNGQRWILSFGVCRTPGDVNCVITTCGGKGHNTIG